jgi:hypothetical protein
MIILPFTQDIPCYEVLGLVIAINSTMASKMASKMASETGGRCGRWG